MGMANDLKEIARARDLLRDAIEFLKKALPFMMMTVAW